MNRTLYSENFGNLEVGARFVDKWRGEEMVKLDEDTGKAVDNDLTITYFSDEEILVEVD